MMKQRWKGAAAALVTALTLTMPTTLAANVTLDGVCLAADRAWVENGVSYITLRSYAELTGCALSWTGTYAVLTGPNLELTAQPGQMYLTANGRTLYVEGGVPVVDGKLVLPLQVLAKATGDQLTWNASTGTAELVCQNAVPASASYDEEDLYWLSRVISAESKGESLTGQIAVGNVVLNRVKSSQYPNSIKAVVFDQTDGVQFEPTSNGSIYDDPTDSAVLAAKLCLEGANVVDDCMYFYAPELSAGTWIVQNCTYYTTIGCHRFYR